MICPYCETTREEGYDSSQCCDGGEIASLKDALRKARGRIRLLMAANRKLAKELKETREEN